MYQHHQLGTTLSHILRAMAVDSGTGPGVIAQNTGYLLYSVTVEHGKSKRMKCIHIINKS